MRYAPTFDGRMQDAPTDICVGRTVATLLTMLVTFAVIGALFVAIDIGAGVRIGVPLAAGTPRATPRPTATAAPRATATAIASPTATAILGPTVTATPWPTPPGGVSPPHYGTSLNYVNNTPFAPAFLTALDRRIIAMTNQQRTAHGLAPLTENNDLDIIAAARSQDMVKRHYFSHFDPTGPPDATGHRPAAVQELLERNNIAYAEVGENLIGNTGFPLNNGTPAQVVGAWMKHPEHRANILHASYTNIGVGIAAEMEPAGLRVIITQVFIR